MAPNDSVIICDKIDGMCLFSDISLGRTLICDIFKLLHTFVYTLYYNRMWIFYATLPQQHTTGSKHRQSVKEEIRRIEDVILTY